jgi:hypothetical protein
MTSIARWFASLGTAGAAANARRVCEERRQADERLKALVAKFEPTEASAPRSAA